MIDKLVSKRTLELERYKVEPKIQGIALDKNEIPWSLNDKVREALIKKVRTMEFNRYPDSDCTELKAAISGYTGVNTDSIGIGNGSDELISILLQTFINPGDTIAVHDPTFSMYKQYATVSGARIWEYNLDGNFEVKLDEFINCIQKEMPKIIFICNPNNPTGGRLELQEIEQILTKAHGIVIVDEAYFEFSGITALGLLHRYEKLIILRTFSKVFGLAGLRVGYMLAAPSVISYIDRVRSPFNVNAFAQAAAVEVLKNIDVVTERIEIIKSERKRLTALLTELEGIQCFESWSNFILVRSQYAGKIDKKLQEAGVYIRRFSNSMLKDCLRITVGSPAENDKFYKIIKEVLYEGV